MRCLPSRQRCIPVPLSRSAATLQHTSGSALRRLCRSHSRATFCARPESGTHPIEFSCRDTFSKFVDACAANGVDLSAPGITVLAPANTACTEYEANGGVLSKEICQYHVVKGEVSSDGLGNADLMTVEGSKITYRRMFRKNFLDNAMCGVKAKSPCDPSYCNDVKCDNGVIHGLTEVIYPGWSESAGGYGSEGDVAATR